MNFNEKSEKYLKAREKLPTKLHHIFKQMVDEYAYHALHYGRNWVVYDVISELVKAGWRPSAEKKLTSDKIKIVEKLADK